MLVVAAVAVAAVVGHSFFKHYDLEGIALGMTRSEVLARLPNAHALGPRHVCAYLPVTSEEAALARYRKPAGLKPAKQPLAKPQPEKTLLVEFDHRDRVCDARLLIVYPVGSFLWSPQQKAAFLAWVSRLYGEPNRYQWFNGFQVTLARWEQRWPKGHLDVRVRPGTAGFASIEFQLKSST